MIRSTCEWESSPFQFRLYPGSLSYIKKGLVAPVLMVEVARDNVSAGIDFFCSSFDGENPLSLCGIPYLFITLYHNQLSDQEHQQIIEDTIHHIGQVSLVHLHGITDIDALVTLWQNITTKLRNVLLSLPAHKSTNRLFLQVEKESELGPLVCAFHSVDSELVMSNLPHLSSYLRQCIVDEDFEKVFIYQDWRDPENFETNPPGNPGAHLVSIRVRGGPSTPPPASAHTNSPPRPSHSFVSLLTNHPFYHHLFSSADIPEDNAMALSSSISQGELVVCCDGSFNPLLHTGSYGTVFATKSSPLLEFSGPCNGSPHQLFAHRAELCSIVVTLKTILAVCKMYNCEGGSVSIYNDCSKAIKQIITPGWKFKRFLIDNYDLIGEAITLLQNLRQTNTINLLWVKGHYTGKQRELQHDLNARVHKIVTKFAQERPCPPATCEPPSTTGSIHLQHALTLKWQATVQEEYHKVLLQLTICKNAGWTDNIFSRVDWDALQRCLLKVPWVTRIGYCKLLHNLLNTNEQNCRYYKTSSICPCPKHFFTLQAAHMRTFSITTTPNKISYGRNWKSFGPPRLL